MAFHLNKLENIVWIETLANFGRIFENQFSPKAETSDLAQLLSSVNLF